jgi:hypothetical protein
VKRKHHPSARTNEATRRTIQQSPKSACALAAELDLDPKTIAKWRKRSSTSEMKKGPKAPRALHLDAASEEFVVYYRLITRLGLDDCMTRLAVCFPKLSRSALHRCFKRRGIARIRPELRMSLAKRPASNAPRRFWVIAYGASDTSAQTGLFAAIDERSFEIFCRPKPLSRFAAADFLAELCEAYPGEIVEAATMKHWLFAATDDEPRPSLHLFAETCRVRRIVHSKRLPSVETLLRVLTPDRRKLKLNGARMSDEKLLLASHRLIDLARGSNHRCPLTMTPWDLYPGSQCLIRGCGSGHLCIFNNKNRYLYS